MPQLFGIMTFVSKTPPSGRKWQFKVKLWSLVARSIFEQSLKFLFLCGAGSKLVKCCVVKLLILCLEVGFPETA
jgi:hypothetical protein